MKFKKIADEVAKGRRFRFSDTNDFIWMDNKHTVLSVGEILHREFELEEVDEYFYKKWSDCFQICFGKKEKTYQPICFLTNISLFNLELIVRLLNENNKSKL